MDGVGDGTAVTILGIQDGTTHGITIGHGIRHGTHLGTMVGVDTMEIMDGEDIMATMEDGIPDGTDITTMEADGMEAETLVGALLRTDATTAIVIVETPLGVTIRADILILPQLAAELHEIIIRDVTQLREEPAEITVRYLREELFQEEIKVLVEEHLQTEIKTLAEEHLQTQVAIKALWGEHVRLPLHHQQREEAAMSALVRPEVENRQTLVRQTHLQDRLTTEVQYLLQVADQADHHQVLLHQALIAAEDHHHLLHLAATIAEDHHLVVAATAAATAAIAEDRRHQEAATAAEAEATVVAAEAEDHHLLAEVAVADAKT